MLSVHNLSVWVIFWTLNILPATLLVSTQLLSLFRGHWWLPICQLDVLSIPKKIYDFLSALYTLQSVAAASTNQNDTDGFYIDNESII